MVHSLTTRVAKENLRAVAAGLPPTRGELDSDDAKVRLRAAAANRMDLPRGLAHAPWTILGMACLLGFLVGKGSGPGTDLSTALLAGLLHRFLRFDRAGWGRRS